MRDKDRDRMTEGDMIWVMCTHKNSDCDLMWSAYLVRKNLVKHIAVIAKGYSAVGCHIVNINVLVQIDNKFTLGVNL